VVNFGALRPAFVKSCKIQNNLSKINIKLYETEKQVLLCKGNSVSGIDFVSIESVSSIVEVLTNIDKWKKKQLNKQTKV